MKTVADRDSARQKQLGKTGVRTVNAVHGLRKAESDPQFELDLAANLRERLGREQLFEFISEIFSRIRLHRPTYAARLFPGACKISRFGSCDRK